MLPSRKILLPLCLVFLLSIVVGCGRDDDGGTSAPPTATTDLPQALEDYWQAQEDMSSSLGDVADAWNAVDAAVDDPDAPTSIVDTLVDQYVAACDAAGERFTGLIELESAIVPYGAQKAAFTDAARATVRDVYASSRDVVVGSSRRLRTSWRVLGGTMCLRDALRVQDAGVSVVSDLTTALQQHLANRDDAIEQAILAGDDHQGLIPITQLAGDTDEERAAAYDVLPDDDPLKLAIRGAVHRWNATERDATLATLRGLALDRLRDFPGVADGGSVAGEIAAHLTSTGQDPGARGGLTQTLSDITTGDPLIDNATVIVRKRNQAPGREKIAVLQGVAAVTTLELPLGIYDVVVVTPHYIRGVEPQLEITDAGSQEIAIPLYDRATHAIILESLTADRTVAGTSETIRLDAVAVSTTGSALQFAWAASGPGGTTFFGRNPSQLFIAEEPGDYAVTLTISDGAGHETAATLPLTILAAAVRVSDIEVRDAGFVDGELNPGEEAVLALTVIGSPDAGISGVASFASRGRAQVVSAPSEEWTFQAGDRTTWPVTVALPDDYSEDEAVFIFTFTTDDAVITQELHLPVAFWAELSPLPTQVTSRVVVVAGQVANPALTLAHLVVNNDLDQVYDVHLDHGIFGEVIILEGAAEPQTISLALVAESGSLRAEDTASFLANFQPAGLRVTLFWDTNGTDVDLWVTDPDGEKCYFAHTTTASGLALDVDDVNGYGPENITCLTPPPGEYLVQVHYYSDHDSDQAIGSNCDIVIRLNENTPDELVAHYTGFLGDTGDLWTVATVTVGDKGMAFGAPAGGIEHVDPTRLPAK